MTLGICIFILLEAYILDKLLEVELLGGRVDTHVVLLAVATFPL